METKPLISVIIPIYNTEDYLEQCIKSVIGQTYDNLEVILVNDGSTDEGGFLCDKFAKQDRRIKVIHKVNGGTTSARKAGIMAASGSYISFVDSDDWIDQDMIQYFVLKLLEYHSDIIVSAVIWEVMEQQKSRKEENELPEGYYNKEKLEKTFYPRMLHYAGNYKFGILQYLCSKLFRKDIIKDILEKVDDRICDGEDVACTYDACLHADSIYVENHFSYHYRQGRIGSQCSKTYGVEHFLNAKLLYSYLKEQFEQSNYSLILLPQLSRYIFAVVNKMTRTMFDYDMAEEWELPLPLLVEKPLVVLYGAGQVGKSYYNQIANLSFVKLVAWVDSNYKRFQNERMSIQEPGTILTKKYDMVLIAVSNEKTACEIRKNLRNMGVEDCKICWTQTEQVINSYELHTYWTIPLWKEN